MRYPHTAVRGAGAAAGHAVLVALFVAGSLVVAGCSKPEEGVTERTRDLLRDLESRSDKNLADYFQDQARPPGLDRVAKGPVMFRAAEVFEPQQRGELWIVDYQVEMSDYPSSLLGFLVKDDLLEQGHPLKPYEKTVKLKGQLCWTKAAGGWKIVRRPPVHEPVGRACFLAAHMSRWRNTLPDKANGLTALGELLPLIEDTSDDNHWGQLTRVDILREISAKLERVDDVGRSTLLENRFLSGSDSLSDATEALTALYRLWLPWWHGRMEDGADVLSGVQQGNVSRDDLRLSPVQLESYSVTRITSEPPDSFVISARLSVSDPACLLAVAVCPAEAPDPDQQLTEFDGWIEVTESFLVSRQQGQWLVECNGDSGVLGYAVRAGRAAQSLRSTVDSSFGPFLFEREFARRVALAADQFSDLRFGPTEPLQDPLTTAYSGLSDRVKKRVLAITEDNRALKTFSPPELCFKLGREVSLYVLYARSEQTARSDADRQRASSRTDKHSSQIRQILRALDVNEADSPRLSQVLMQARLKTDGSLTDRPTEISQWIEQHYGPAMVCIFNVGFEAELGDTYAAWADGESEPDEALCGRFMRTMKRLLDDLNQIRGARATAKRTIDRWILEARLLSELPGNEEIDPLTKFDFLFDFSVKFASLDDLLDIARDDEEADSTRDDPFAMPLPPAPLAEEAPPPAPAEAPPPAPSPFDKTVDVAGAEDEIWEVYELQGTPVGYTHTTVSRETLDGEEVLRFVALSEMSVKRAGEQVRIGGEATSIETPDGKLREFDIRGSQGPVVVTSAGRVAGGQLKLEVTAGGETTTSSIPWSDEYGGLHALELSLSNQPMEPGEKRTIEAFVPGLNQVLSHELVAQDIESVEMPEGTQKLLRIDATTDLSDDQRHRVSIWTDKSGKILRRHEGLMNLVAYRTTREVALAQTDVARFDLATAFSVPVNRRLHRPHDSKRIRYRIRLEGRDPAEVFAVGESQAVKSMGPETAEVTVYSVTPDLPGNLAAPADPPADADRRPNSTVQSDDPVIVDLADTAVGGETDAWRIVLALERFVQSYVTADNSQPFATAAQVAESGVGDATAHSVLLAALARAKGIPARVAVGLVYREHASEPTFAYSMWNEVYVRGRWIPLDGTLARGGVGAARIKLTHSSLDGASSVVFFAAVGSVAGRMEIEILEVEPPDEQPVPSLPEIDSPAPERAPAPTPAEETPAPPLPDAPPLPPALPLPPPAPVDDEDPFAMPPDDLAAPQPAERSPFPSPVERNESGDTSPSHWREFASEEGGFTVLMPGTPKESQESAGTSTIHRFAVEDPDKSVSYLVTYSDHPDSSARRFPPGLRLYLTCVGIATAANGRLTSMQKISLQGYPGMEMCLVFSVDDKPASAKARVYLANQRLYQVEVAGLEGVSSSPDADEFLDSFKLATHEDGMKPRGDGAVPSEEVPAPPVPSVDSPAAESPPAPPPAEAPPAPAPAEPAPAPAEPAPAPPVSEEDPFAIPPDDAAPASPYLSLLRPEASRYSSGARGSEGSRTLPDPDAAIPEQQGPEAIEQDLEELAAEYAVQLAELAAWCDSRGLAAQARQTRSWLSLQDPGNLCLPALPQQVYWSDMPGDTAAEVMEWRTRLRQLRCRYADSLFDMARQAIRRGRASLAFDLLMAAARENPDHDPARRLLGYQTYRGQWHTSYEIGKLRAGQAWHETFGWLPRSHVSRYEQGDRYHNGRWITHEEDARLHHDINSGWNVETEHYTIRTNHSLEAAVQVGEKLESLHRAWRQLFIRYYATQQQMLALFSDGGEDTQALAFPRQNVVYFRDREDYNNSLRAAFPNIEISTGVYVLGNRRAYFFHEGTQPDRSLYHQATNQLFCESRPVSPEAGEPANFWIIPGISTYMESLREEDGCCILGGFEDARMQAARYRLLHDGFYVPLEELTTYGRDKFHTDSRIATLFSQAAGLTHFLMHYDRGRYRDALIGYLVAVYSGRHDSATLAQLTGTSYSELDKQYRGFMEAGTE